MVLDAPVTQDVNGHHQNPEVYEQKHGVKPGAFAAVQNRCHGHQHICHKMHCEEATHLKSEEEGAKVGPKRVTTIPTHLVNFTRMIRNNKLSRHAREVHVHV